MARGLRYWICGGCGETLQGIKDKEGDFISDKELDTQPVARLRAAGCYMCGYDTGDFGEEVEEAVEA